MDNNRLLTNSDGSLRFPVGFRFCPSDKLFVAWYLKRKALSIKTTGVDVVPEFDVFQTEPKNLPSDGKVFLETKYFYLNLKDRIFEDNGKRNAGSGQWRTEGEIKNLVNKNNRLIGRRNKLVFWRNKRTQFVKTKWVMYEYRLFLPATAPHPPQMSSWAGYKIFLKNGKKNKRAKVSYGENSDSDSYLNELEEIEDVEPSEVNFAEEISGTNTGPPSPSSSESSRTNQ